MFEWKIEDLALLNKKSSVLLGKERIWNCESETSREDKIAFVDSLQDGKLSYLLFLIDKFNADKDSMPKDKYGFVKTVSLKAWIKRNDTRYKKPIIDNCYNYGKFRILGSERWITSLFKFPYDTYDDLVDEAFHRQLKECKNQEYKYFLEHDEYSVLKEKFRNKKHGTTFGVNIAECSDGNIYIYETKDDFYNSKSREITIDELKYFLSKYDELDKLVQKITEETHITV